MIDATGSNQRIPPYTSFVSLRSMVEWLKEMEPLPARIDRSLWSSKYSGSAGPPLMASARFLGLLDEERPTQALVELVQANDEMRKKKLEELIRRGYGEDFVNAVPTMTPKMLDDHLRNMGTTDSTHRKAVSFLINALKETDVSVPTAIAKKARNTPVRTKRKNSPRKTQPVDSPSVADEQALDQADNLQATKSTQNLRTLDLGEGVEAQLVIRGNMLALPNVSQVVKWLDGVLEAFNEDVGGTEQEDRTVGNTDK